MNRLGANVFAYDIRPETKEQAQSLGATSSIPTTRRKTRKRTGSRSTARGLRQVHGLLGFYSFAEPPRDRYIVEGEEDPSEGQERKKTRVGPGEVGGGPEAHPRAHEGDGHRHHHGARAGRKAPTLVDKDMVESMKPGSVIVDLAAESGGNCELTEPGETVKHNEVTIVGPVNVPSALPIHASQLLSRNMYNLIDHITRTEPRTRTRRKDPQSVGLRGRDHRAPCIATAARSGTTTCEARSASERREPGTTPRAISHLHQSRFPGVRVDLTGPEHAPHAAHERDQRNPRHRPGRGDHRDRHGNDIFTIVVGFIAVVFGAMNVVGGFWVTNRMLGMFRPPKPE
jgi:hypothetical protein